MEIRVLAAAESHRAVACGGVGNVVAGQAGGGVVAAGDFVREGAGLVSHADVLLPQVLAGGDVAASARDAVDEES